VRRSLGAATIALVVAASCGGGDATGARSAHRPAPAPGTVVLCAGPPTTLTTTLRVPSVVGLSLDGAAHELACGSGYRRITTVPTPAPGSGLVTAQDPPAGFLATADTPIVLAVSTAGALHRIG
jgi:hypothetical protein